MSIKQYISPNTQRKPGNILAGKKGPKVGNWMAKQIVGRNEQASQFHGHAYYYYQRITQGHLCSCHQGGIPDGHCQLCYGTGWIGGYHKWGTQLSVFDVNKFHTLTGKVDLTTRLNLNTRPNGWTLTGSGTGYIYWELDVGRWFYVDNTHVLKQGDVKIQWYSADDWHDINTFSGSGRVKFRAVLSGKNNIRPLFFGMWIRTQILKDLKVKINIPRIETTRELNQWGFFDSANQLQLWFAGNYIQNIRQQDWFYNINEGSRWKITSLNPNKVYKYLTSWDINTRLVQPFDIISNFPK